MGETTSISWCHHTASPWFGCTEVSPGCRECYSRELTLKYKWAGWGNGNPRVRSKGFWKDVYKWDKAAAGKEERPRIFTSLMDPFDMMVPIDWFVQYLDVIRRTVHLDHLLLTKRPQFWRERMEEGLAAMANDCESEFYDTPEDAKLAVWMRQWLDGDAPYHVWFGVSVEDQKRADERLPVLCSVPAQIRWLSVEPLLQDITLDFSIRNKDESITRPPISWCVIGGESGKNRRDCGLYALLHVAAQCQEVNVPVWMKQDSALKPGQQGRIPDNAWKMKQLPRL